MIPSIFYLKIRGIKLDKTDDSKTPWLVVLGKGGCFVVPTLICFEPRPSLFLICAEIVGMLMLPV